MIKNETKWQTQSICQWEEREWKRMREWERETPNGSAAESDRGTFQSERIEDREDDQNREDDGFIQLRERQISIVNYGEDTFILRWRWCCGEGRGELVEDHFLDFEKKKTCNCWIDSIDFMVCFLIVCRLRIMCVLLAIKTIIDL